MQRIYAAPCPIEREFIFVNDCSKDRSLEVLNGLKEKYKFVLENHPVNKGKGAAIITGIQRATGEYVVIQDADFEYDPSEIPSLLAPLMDGRADVVFGSRFRDGSPQVHRTFHYFVNWALTFMSNLLSGIRLTDMETCYKLFRSDLLKAMQIQSQRFGIEVEVTAYVAKARARVFEMPISYFPRTHLQGKKISWRDGVAALFHLLRFNCFTPFEKAFKDLPQRYHP